MKPPVSVCLPVYNGMPFLTLAIDSILSSNYPGLELIISLDTSSDGSEEYVGRLTDPRVRVVYNVKRGLFQNLNNALRHASHDLIQVFCQDDVMLSSFLESQALRFSSDPTLGLVLAHCGKIDGSDEEAIITEEPGEDGVLDRGAWLWKQAHHGSVADSISCIMLNRRVLKEQAKFDETFSVAGDVEFYNRIALQFKIAYNGKRLFLNRGHPKQESRKWTSVLPYAREERRIHCEHWVRILPVDLLDEVSRYRAHLRGVLHIRSAVKMLAKGHLVTAILVFKEVARTYGLLNLIMAASHSRRYKAPTIPQRAFKNIL